MFLISVQIRSLPIHHTDVIHSEHWHRKLPARPSFTPPLMFRFHPHGVSKYLHGQQHSSVAYSKDFKSVSVYHQFYAL